ncbi:hypothetical protein [Anaerosinus sp.]
MIEASLLAKKKPIDLSYKLKELKGTERFGYVVNVFLGLCYKSLLNEKFSLKEIYFFLNDLINSDKILDDDMITDINTLTDGYYLAEMRIYGEIEDASMEIRRFLAQFEKFTEEFRID